MSLIERALEKVREVTDVATVLGTRTSAQSAPRPASQPLASPLTERPIRVAAVPDLEITPEMLVAQGLQALPEQRGQQRGEYRHIKRQILAEVGPAPADRLLLVTSALEGEGKSFSAANLALSLAMEPDYSVLLVDADVIRPNLTRTFGLTDRPGFMDAAADPSIDVNSLVVTTNIEGFSILPAGRSHPNATEHFGSSRTREILDQLLAAPRRIVVMDSLPLLLTTEARVLASLGGRVLMVVRAESTPRTAVLQALDLLGEHTNVQLILNAVVRTKLLSYVGYGYGYGYTYNYGSQE
jgi:protein-tyrosine kinase